MNEHSGRYPRGSRRMVKSGPAQRVNAAPPQRGTLSIPSSCCGAMQTRKPSMYRTGLRYCILQYLLLAFHERDDAIAAGYRTRARSLERMAGVEAGG